MNVELLRVYGSEIELGQIAQFCHAPFSAPFVEDGQTPEYYAELVVNCYKRRHMSVFEFASLLYRVDCPIFVARQLVRHRNGTFMEKSLRYMEPMTLGEYVAYAKDDAFDPFHDYRGAYADALMTYKELVEAGERKERARAVLPLGTPTSFLWHISLRSLFNVFDQRLAATAQKETRNVVKRMYDLAKESFPNILAAYENKEAEA